MIQNNVVQFRHILGLSFVQQNIFDMLNTFSRYQQIQAALVMEFRNTRPKITLVGIIPVTGVSNGYVEVQV